MVLHFKQKKFVFLYPLTDDESASVAFKARGGRVAVERYGHGQRYSLKRDRGVVNKWRGSETGKNVTKGKT